MGNEGDNTMLDILALKDKLINSGLCIDNQYLDLYTNIIVNNLNTPRIKFKTEKHHIVPKFYFKYMKMACDNSELNIINLYNTDHIKAHVYQPRFNMSALNCVKFSSSTTIIAVLDCLSLI